MKLAQVAVVSAILLAVSGLGALAQPCTLQRVGVDHAVVEAMDGPVTYRVELNRPKWDLDRLGWHAQAMLACEGCAPGQVMGGYLWMSAQTHAAALPTADEDQRFVALTGSIWFAAQGTKALRMIDELRGEWSGLSMMAWRFADSESGTRFGNLALTVADGCFRMRLFLQSAAAHRLPLRDALRPLMEGVAIRRQTVPR